MNFPHILDFLLFESEREMFFEIIFSRNKRPDAIIRIFWMKISGNKEGIAGKILI